MFGFENQYEILYDPLTDCVESALTYYFLVPSAVVTDISHTNKRKRKSTKDFAFPVVTNMTNNYTSDSESNNSRPSDVSVPDIFYTTSPDGITDQSNTTTSDGIGYRRDAREQVAAPVMTALMGSLAVFGNILTILTILRNKK